MLRQQILELEKKLDKKPAAVFNLLNEAKTQDMQIIRGHHSLSLDIIHHH